MTQFTYDRETDILYIRLDPGAVHANSETLESESLFAVLDLDAEGRLYGIEILDASRTVNLAALGALEPSKA